MRFLVKTFDTATSQVLEAVEEGDSPSVVKQRLAGLGRIVLSLRVHEAERWRVASRFDTVWWCQELRTLLTAGMTVVEALETLHAQPTQASRRHVHQQLLSQLQQGSSLSQAMRDVGAFPAVLVAGVKAGERTSALIPALEDFLRYDKLIQGLRKQVTNAAIYPAMVATLGAFIATFLLLFVMPRFARMYGDDTRAVSATTQLLLWFSKQLSHHGGLVLFMLMLVIAALGLLWRQGDLARWSATILTKLPLTAHALNQFRLAKFYQALTLMFRGGYSLTDALGQSEMMGLGEQISEQARKAQQAMGRGQRVSVSLTEAGLTDSTTSRLIAAGERTGNFDQVLQIVSERHAANFTTFVERVSRVVEPLLLLLVALLVGAIVVAMYMPVFDMASSVR
jgi:general secretion pathway protein F